MYVVATAGHVDHGKSTLIRALTGMEPDRWAEERRRGMTIDLGYAWCTLPSGATLAVVDVPGHHRFVPNMLAGVGPVPAVLFVVAADEGWGRQSTEHLAALDALGVRHGLLAVTRDDLADPGPATEGALARFADTALGRVPAVTVSGATGAGLDDLRVALDRLVASLPAPRPEAPVRLWADRVFTVKGSGTVVTGTLGAGRLRVGDTLELAPGGRRVTVRGLQTLRRPAHEVAAVARVAVNLRGVEVDDLSRGDALLTPGTWTLTDTVDVRLRGIGPAGLPRSLVLHVGSAALPARVRPLSGDTARLTLAHPLPLRPGDRALLRDPGRARIAAGVLVVDVDPPSLRRRGEAAARGHALADAGGYPDPYEQVVRRGAATRAQLALWGVLDREAAPPSGLTVLGEWLVAPERWAGWERDLVAAVDEHAHAAPLEPGWSEGAATARLGLPDPRLLAPLAAAAGLTIQAGRVRRPDTGPTFSPAATHALDELRAQLHGAPFAAPEQPELDRLGLDPRTLAAAVTAGLLLRVAPGIFLLPDAPEEAVRRLREVPAPFTMSAARQALATTRRVAVPLLEYLDGQRLTRRIDPRHRVVVE